MSKHRSLVFNVDTQELTRQAYKPKHRAHRFAYLAAYDRWGQSRAECPSITPRYCGVSMCPLHNARNYTEHMARHATDSIMPDDIVPDDIGEDEDA